MKRKILILLSVTFFLIMLLIVKFFTGNIDNIIQVKAGDNFYIEKLSTGGIEITKFDSQNIKNILFSNTHFSKIGANSNNVVAIDMAGKLYYWENIVENVDGEVIYPLKTLKVKDVSIGDNHVVAVSNDGEIYVWGNNEYNQLGLGNDSISVDAKNPVCLNIPNERFCKVSCGALSTLALTEEGNVYEWGYLEKVISISEVENTQVAIPTKINIDSRIADVKNGFLFSLLLTNEGKVLGRGRNEFGQCLPNIEEPFVNEYTLLELEEDISKISVGSDHVMALGSSGNLYSWGKNEYGQLGMEKAEHNKVNLIEIDDKISDIFLTNNSSIIIGEKKYCSGEFNHKLLDMLYKKGYIGLVISEKNKDIEIGNIRKISSGYANSICIDSLNNAYTWGIYLDGALGRKEAVDVDKPELIEKLKNVCTDGVSISGVTTILTNEGKIYNFGNNQGGRLGIGNSLNQWEPVEVNIDGRITRFFMGVSATLANTDTGEWYAWGDNQHGSLLTGDTEFYSIPVKINIPFDVKKISSYSTHTLLLNKNGEVYQYGDINDGGLGTRLNFQHIDFDERIIDIATGPKSCFAISETGNVYAWGNNIMGYLGLNEKDIYITPQKINFKEKMSKINISPMLCQVVALSDSGNIYTWGFDSMKSSKEQFLEFPVKIEMPEKISEIVVGDVTVYAITDSGNTFTWGGVINNVDKKPQREPVLYSFR